MKHHLRRWKQSREDDALREEFKQHRNSYFRAINEAKKECWDTFLADAKGKEVFTAFHYTKPRRAQLTPTLQTPEGTVITTVGKSQGLTATAPPLQRSSLQVDTPYV